MQQEMMTAGQECRLILDGPGDGPWNMGADEFLLRHGDPHGRPILRLYRWSEPTLSLGYFQHAAARNQHGPSHECRLVRRASGGGAILHDDELTYSLVLPMSARWSADAGNLYQIVHATIVAFLAQASVPSELCLAPSEVSLAPSHADLTPPALSLAPNRADLTPPALSLAPNRADLTPPALSLAPSRADLTPPAPSLAPSRADLTPPALSLAPSHADMTPPAPSLAPTTAPSLAPSHADMTPPAPSLAPTEVGPVQRNQPFLCFERRSPGDVLCRTFKVVGSAQRRHLGRILQHGSVLLGRSAYVPELPGLRELACHPTHPTANSIASVDYWEQVWPAWLARSLNWRLVDESWSELERSKIMTGDRKKFESDDWTHRR